MLEQKLDSAFRSTCRSIFGQEVGSLAEFREYLTSISEPVTRRKSSVSGRDVHLSYLEYPKKGRFITYDEIKGPPDYKLNINQIKDIDSLVGAVKENFYYCGDKNLGKSLEVRGSDGCMDAGFVLDSHEMYNCQYIAYSSYMESSKYIFGSAYALLINTVMTTVHSYMGARIFQTGFSSKSSDIYLCWYMMDCKECILSFNQRNKKHLVGNVQLSREEYLPLKKKLVGEMAEVLEKKKSFPTIFEIAEGVEP